MAPLEVTFCSTTAMEAGKCKNIKILLKIVIFSPPLLTNLVIYYSKIIQYCCCAPHSWKMEIAHHL